MRADCCLFAICRKHLAELNYPAPRTVSKLEDQVCRALLQRWAYFWLTARRCSASKFHGLRSVLPARFRETTLLHASYALMIELPSSIFRANGKRVALRRYKRAEAALAPRCVSPNRLTAMLILRFRKKHTGDIALL